MLPGPHSPQLSIYLNRTYPWTYKGGGLEFFYQFTITPIQISDPIFLYCPITKKNTLRIYYFFILLWYYFMFLSFPGCQTMRLLDPPRKKKDPDPGHDQWPFPLRYTDFFKTKYVFFKLYLFFFRLFSCQNLMNRSEIKIF